jgi:glycosyltransferase involved in cell wall biosynthesis
MKSNLLFINSITIYGGGEVWMINAMKEFASRGYKVLLICKPESEIKNCALKEGIDTITMSIAGEGDPFTIYKLLKIIKQKKIDFIITNTAKELRLSGIVSKLSGRTKVIARQGIDYPLKNTLRYRFTYNLLADAIVANSEATKKTILKNAPWLNPDKVKVIYNGIDTDLYSQANTKSLRDEIGFSNDDKIIGFAGRLNVQKGVKYLLEAFKVVAEKSSSAKLLIVGKGDLETYVKEFTAKHNLKSRIHFAGFREDIPNIMRTIDILVLPSLWEGFGIVLIEAMAAGKPCVATNISSIPEIMMDGENGFLVPPENTQAIADALMKLVSDEKLSERLGRKGSEIVNEKFTIDRMIRNYEKLLNQSY